jgi:hypothetical protein
LSGKGLGRSALPLPGVCRASAGRIISGIEPATCAGIFMGRKPKSYSTKAELIARYLARAHNQELAGQTKLAHYHKTKFVECAICEAQDVKLHRHRIVPGTEYTDENTIIVCVVCHKLIHKIYNETKADNLFDYQLAILLAKLEVK